MSGIISWLSATAKKFNDADAFKEMKFEIPADIEVTCDVPYSGRQGNALAADIYRPASPVAASLPVVVMVHGGGLFSGSRTLNRAFCVELVRAGCLVFAIGYRLIDETDICGEIDDLCAGYNFVQTMMENYGGDTERIAVIAESAGAFLALYATAMIRSETLGGILGCSPSLLNVRALICISGMFYTGRPDPIGMVYRKELYGSHCRKEVARILMDPGNPDIVTNLPPVLLTSSKGDFLRNYTLQYSAALHAQEHPCELIYYPEGRHLRHAFPSLMPWIPESRDVLTRIKAWLDGIYQDKYFPEIAEMKAAMAADNEHFH